MMTLSEVRREPTPMPDNLRKVAIAATAAGALLLVPAAILDVQRFLANWLVLAFFVLTVGIGSLFLVALEFAVNARWSVPFRRISENFSALILVSIVLLVPVFLGVDSLYEWTHEDVVAADPILQKKAGYLNVPFFLLRIAGYFLIWLLFYKLFVLDSRRQDATGDERYTRRSIKLAPPFMILYAVTISLAAIDLLMSLAPHWYSSMFGPYVGIGAVVAGLAASTLAAVLLKMNRLFPDSIGRDHFYSFGALLFAMNTFWAYLGFAQFMLIWYGNIPVEMAFYRARSVGGWEIVSALLIIGHFFVPFFALLARSAKMDLRRLRWVAVWLLVMHWLDLYWIVLPSIPHLSGGPFSWTDLGFPLVALGLGIVVWLWRSSRAPLIPVGDPRLEAGLAFHL